MLSVMKLIFYIVLLFLLPIMSFSQSQFQVSSHSNFTISGTSTMHDWTMETESAQGTAIFKVEDGKLLGIHRLHLSVPAESLRSGKNMMDKNAHNALKVDQHPTIQFDLIGVDQLQQEDGTTQVICMGELSIAGTTRQENLMVVCRSVGENELSFEGVKKLNMSDFNIDPPTFMFGTLKTGDEITVSFQILFDQKLDNKTTYIP